MVRVWDLGSGDPLGDPFTGDTGGVTAVAVGELDGRPIVVSGSWDSTVRVWDLATGGNPRVIRLGVSVLSVTKPKNDLVVIFTLPTPFVSLPAQPGLLLLDEVGAGVGLGVGRGPRPGEPLDHVDHRRPLTWPARRSRATGAATTSRSDTSVVCI
jgi:hypothetical protein